jgi:LPXTG-motif cell wall-anchored protein
MIDFLIWFWNAGELLMIIGVSIIIIGLIFYRKKREDTKRELGYEPRFSLEEGIKSYLPEIKRIYEEEVK